MDWQLYLFCNLFWIGGINVKKNSFSMIDEKGNEVIYDVLFTFESDETNKNYINLIFSFMI